MNKLISAAVITVIAASCAKNEKPTEYGNISLTIEQGASAFVENSTKATATIPDEYQVVTTTAADAQVAAGTGTYGTLKGGFTIPTGTGYKISAFNCSANDAESKPDSKGQQRFFGSSTFDITAGNLAVVTFTCSMANSKVSVGYDNSFASQFTNYSVQVSSAVNTTRIIDFTNASTVDSPVAFFNVDPTTPTLNIKITGTRKTDSVAKTYNQTITLLAKTWHKLSIKATSVSGSANLDITVDHSMAEVSSDISIDPYAN
ncbi:MAG: DUF4493 domain-containing protein [Bacteroidales bacterium]